MKNAKGPSSTAKGAKKLSGILQGTKCLVEAFNEDGTDASKGYIQSILTMGGEIKTMLAKDVTHYICSNVDDRDTLAAQLMNIHVLSPLWITQCMDSEQRVPEEDFAISTTLLRRVEEWLGPARYQLADRPARLSEPIPNRAQRGRSLDSPSFSSSQKYRREDSEARQPSTLAPPSPTPSATAPAPVFSSFSLSHAEVSAIPVPLYRKHNIPHPLSKAVSEKFDVSLRRSERILDLSDGESSEEESDVDQGEWVSGLIGPPHRPVPYTTLREEAAEDDHHIHNIFPNLFTEAGRRKEIKLMDVQEDRGKGSGDSGWIQEALGQAVPARDLPAKIPALSAQEVAIAEQNRAIKEREMEKAKQKEKEKSASNKSPTKKQTTKGKDSTALPAPPSLSPPPSASRRSLAAVTAPIAVTPVSLSLSASPRQRGRRKSDETSCSITPTRSAVDTSRAPQTDDDEATEEIASKAKAKGKNQKELQLPLRGAVFGVYSSSSPEEEDVESEDCLRQIVSGLIKTIQNRKGTKDKRTEEADQAAIVSLQSQNIREGKAKFTHLIMAQNTVKRPLCAIVAMARGLPILTSQYLYDSLSQERWIEDLSSYRCPRYAHLRLKPSIVLHDKVILLLKTSSPDADIYKDILSTCGAAVYEGVRMIFDKEVNYIAIGNDDQDFDTWVKDSLQRGAKGRAELEEIKLQLEKNVPVVCSKFFFNCIEKSRTHKPVDVGEVINKHEAIARIRQYGGYNDKRSGVKRAADMTSQDEGRNEEQPAQSSKRAKATSTPQLLLQALPPSPSPSPLDAQKIHGMAGAGSGDHGAGSQGIMGGLLVTAVSTIWSAFSPAAPKAPLLPPPSLHPAPLLAALSAERRETTFSSSSRGGNLKRLGSKASDPPSTQQAADSLLSLSIGTGHKRGMKNRQAVEEDDLIDSADESAASSKEKVGDDISEFDDDDDDDYDRLVSKPRVKVVASASKQIGSKENSRRNSYGLTRLQKGQSKITFKK